MLIHAESLHCTNTNDHVQQGLGKSQTEVSKIGSEKAPASLQPPLLVFWFPLMSRRVIIILDTSICMSTAVPRLQEHLRLLLEQQMANKTSYNLIWWVKRRPRALSLSLSLSLSWSKTILTDPYCEWMQLFSVVHFPKRLNPFSAMFLVQMKQNLQKQKACLATMWTAPLESTHGELSYEWSHLYVSLDSSGFRSFLGSVKLTFAVKGLNYLEMACSNTLFI